MIPWDECDLDLLTIEGSREEHVKFKITNFLILMPFGSSMCVLHDAKIKTGEETAFSHVMSNKRKHNTVHGNKLSL